MYDIIIGFISKCMDQWCRQFVEFLSGLAEDVFRSAFKIETWSGLDETVLSTAVVKNMLLAMYAFLILLLAVKVISKGWKVYVLWRDGEAENSPVEYLVGAIFALATALAFPLLYDGAVDITMEIGNALFSVTGWAAFGSDADSIFGIALDLFDWIGNNSNGLVIFAGLMFFILLLVLYFKMLVKGVELLIWRLGVPLAAVGLVDSDGGCFKPYIQVFIKELAAVLAQYVCLVLGVLIASGATIGSMLVSFAFMIAGISAPKLLSQFMAPGGGGGAQKISTAAMVIRTFIVK